MKIYDSVQKHQPGVSYFPMITFGSIESKSHIFLRFRSGASTRSLVSSYDSVREHQPGVSYLLTISFGSINPESRIFLRFHSGVSTRSLVFFLRFNSRNVPIFRIEVLEENSKKSKKWRRKNEKNEGPCIGVEEFLDKIGVLGLSLFLILRNVQRGAAVDT